MKKKNYTWGKIVIATLSWTHIDEFIEQLGTYTEEESVERNYFQWAYNNILLSLLH